MSCLSVRPSIISGWPLHLRRRRAAQAAIGRCRYASPRAIMAQIVRAILLVKEFLKYILITHHPQPRVPCQAPVNPRFKHVVHSLGRWLPVETRAGIEATDKANSLRKAPTH